MRIQSPPAQEGPRLQWLAKNAQRLAETIRLFFPVCGRLWSFEGSDLKRGFAEVLDLARLVEGPLNPARLRIDHPDRCRPAWCFKGLPEMPDVLAAVEALIHFHGQILTHYRWTALCTGGLPDHPWEWPNVPPIMPEVLDHLERAAAYLLETLERRKRYFECPQPLEPEGPTPGMTALPQGPGETTAQVEQPVIWDHGDRSYSTDAQTPSRVSHEMHNALKAFLGKDQAIDTEGLEDAGVTNVSKVMGKIQSRFGADAVRRPTWRGEGYFIRVRSLNRETTTGYPRAS
jgi:hypothetical protein